MLLLTSFYNIYTLVPFVKILWIIVGLIYSAETIDSYTVAKS